MTETEPKTILTKGEYAALKRRGPTAVSNWIAAGRITPAALLGTGGRAKVWVEQADRDLARSLNPGQQDRQRHPITPAPMSFAAPGDTAAAADEPNEVVEGIRQARLDQLRHQNRRLAEEAALRSGRYMLAADATQQMGRISSSLLQTLEGWLQEMLQAFAGHFSIPLRDLQHEAARRYRELRERAAVELSDQARKMPRLTQDEDGGETGE
jgi:hypothetical protein